MSDNPLYESCAWHPALMLGPLVSMQSKGVQLQFSLSPQAIMEAEQSKQPLKLFSLAFNPSADCYLVGDGLQMLAQSRGRPWQIEDLGRCPDNDASYRIYPANEAKRLYNYLMIEDQGRFWLLGFCTCHRFHGYFQWRHEQDQWWIDAFVDTQAIPASQWPDLQLESVLLAQSSQLSQLHDLFAQQIALQHPPRQRHKQLNAQSIKGWCSWYGYYQHISEHQVLANLACMQPPLNLNYVLIDDGYQAYMGDWLSPSERFPAGLKALTDRIHQAGKTPAIWLAPFIAQAESELWQRHPDWFVRHADGQLLKAEDISYGGWRCTPWYVLDCSHPEVQQHLTGVVKTMREQWGVGLFKLDANYWGCLPGLRWQAGVTGVQAYRLGMQAIIDGAGDAILLGCNACNWPSLGLLDAMRLADDVERTPARFRQIGQELLQRAWQHQRLWQMDPDCVTLQALPGGESQAGEADFLLHRTLMLALSGLLISGDRLPELSTHNQNYLLALLARQELNNSSVVLEHLQAEQGCIELGQGQFLHLAWQFDKAQRQVRFFNSSPTNWFDYWTGQQLNSLLCQEFLLQLTPDRPGAALIARPPA